MTTTIRFRIVFLLGIALVASACQIAGDDSTDTAPNEVATPAPTAPHQTTVTPPGPSTLLLPDGFDLQGHRGARGLKPENTLPGFEAALDVGVTTLEADLHFSADGEVVVWHDPVIDASKCGLGSGAPADVPDPDDPDVGDDALAIRSLTVEQLGWYQCDRNPDTARFTEQDSTATPLAGVSYAIVTLDQLFDFVERYAADESKTEEQRRTAQSVAFNIETKRRPDNPAAIGDGFNGATVGPFEERLLEIIEESGMSERTTIQSFDPRSLRAIRAADPTIPLAMLVSGGRSDFDELVDWGISIWSPNLEQVTDQRVIDAHDAGLAVVPWTIETVEQAERLVEAGVDGFITDRPDLFTVTP